MSVINNLGELKSGHHAGLDLKEVWAGGERVWSAARQFSAYGPRASTMWGVVSLYDGWDRDVPTLGDHSIYEPTDLRFEVIFNVRVTCDRPVVARRRDNHPLISYEPGMPIPRDYKIMAPAKDFNPPNELGAYFTFTEVT